MCLFDEPLSNLDAKLRLQTRGEIARLQRELGTTTIYVTHDQVEAMTLGHRIALLDAGRLQQLGAPLELYERPANRFVAGFLGSPPMNFFPAAAERGGTLGGRGFRFGIRFKESADSTLHDGAHVIVGVRPERLIPATDSGAAHGSQVQGEVELVEPLGGEAVIYLRVGDLRVAARTAAVKLPTVGDRLTLTTEPGALHLFDAASGARVNVA